jgi:membrane-bound ClpP family serine protease
MKIWVPMALQALAFAVAIGEIMLPSFGLLSLVCAALFGWSWFMLVNHFGSTACILFGAADLVLIPVFIRFAFLYLGKSSISHKTDVGHGSGLEKIDGELQRHVGVTALVDAPLRPVGRIRIGDDTFEAHTAGDWVERGASVKVTAVKGSRFAVEKIDT